jgi:hypothetical protein
MLGDKSLQIAFATGDGVDPAEIGRARRALGSDLAATWQR